MSRKFTYADAGVDRERRTKSKQSLKILQETYRFSYYGEVVQLPYGNIFPMGGDRYLDFVIEGVGTKVLVAQLARKYDTIGIDGVAMAVNDVIRSGAKPLAIVDNIHAEISDPALVNEWMKGVARGAIEAECIVSGGETGDVAELIKGVEGERGFDMIVAAIGEVSKENVISGRAIKAGDVVVGLRSSGIHSNGLSLARKVLFKRWGGRFHAHDIPEELDKEIVHEVLTPTKIYVKPLLEITKQVEVKGAVHVTGDAYLKFYHLAKFSEGIGFEFNNFKPQPVFQLIQKAASELGGAVTDEEMFKTFNMGWGFAVILDKKDVDDAVDLAENTGTHTEEIGHVTDAIGIRILHKNKRISIK